MIANLQSLFTLVFVVSSMFSVGLALTPREIVAPLRSVRTVGFAPLANFVIVPLAAYLLSGIISDPQFRIGLILLGAAAGAPFLLKLVETAEADMTYAVGLLVLLLVGTVVFLPLAASAAANTCRRITSIGGPGAAEPPRASGATEVWSE